MRYAALFLSILVVFSSASYAQWSTSTRAESTLYVCPGFYPGIVSFDDGSSIVLGALQSYIFARKLDEYGYYQWPAVQVHYNDSSYVTDVFPYGDWGGWISDGDGGVILFWYDRRGAYDTGMDWANSAIYVQRVDKFGTVRWTPGGVLVKGPATGRKKGGVVSDGTGGFVIAWIDYGFNYPDAPNRQFLRATRYDSNAAKLWERNIDSSQNRFDSNYLSHVKRGGSRLYIGYMLGNNYDRIIGLDGTIFTLIRTRIWSGISSERDRFVYLNSHDTQNHVMKFDEGGDTLWQTTIPLADTCRYIGGFVPDGHGGTFLLNICADSIVHIDSVGQDSRRRFAGIEFGGREFPDGNHGIVLASASTAKRFNEAGNMIWAGAVLYLQNPGDAYFALYAPDKKGGVIVAFWTTRGGIFAQHTGRYGQVGVITSVPAGAILPNSIILQQNYPNPFNSTTTIRYALPQNGLVELSVFNVLGQKVATLVNGEQTPGYHAVEWDATNVSSGVYFYRITAGSYVETRKMILMK